MEELRREAMCDKTELLLFDILKELKNISSKLDNLNQVAEKGEVVEKVKHINKVEAKTGKVCKHCGEIHERPVEYAMCAKKNNKGKVK